MKKSMLVVVFGMLLVLPLIALAETAGAADNAYDWGQLATVAGATAATLLIVQFVKLPLDKVWKIPTRAVVYCIAFLIVLGAKAFTGGLAVSDVPLLAINAFVIALAAMGSYELTFAKNK